MFVQGAAAAPGGGGGAATPDNPREMKDAADPNYMTLAGLDDDQFKK